MAFPSIDPDPRAEQLAFLQDECWMLAKLAAFGRSRTYADQATEAQRMDLQRALRDFVLQQIIPAYLEASAPISDEQHEFNIQRISDWSCVFAAILRSGCLRIGIAQKLLNLYLKYLWCLGLMPHEPPHFPVDAVMLAGLKHQSGGWTRMDSLEDYRRIIELARRAANEQGLTLAQWELMVYSRNR